MGGHIRSQEAFQIERKIQITSINGYEMLKVIRACYTQNEDKCKIKIKYNKLKPLREL